MPPNNKTATSWLKCKLSLAGQLFLLLLLTLTLLSGCNSSSGLDNQINQATDHFRFGLFSWEVKTLAKKLVEPFSRDHKDTADSEEKQIEMRVREAFSSEGIYNPADKWLHMKITFPPITLFLGGPPHLLVVSPRDHVDNIKSVTLIPDMKPADIESIEFKVDKLGYSALIVDLGGMATFPSYVSNDADIHFILESTAHEWMHQYLAFTPLGFPYVLDQFGIWQNYDISTMNETVADMIGREIGDEVYQKYYASPATNNVSAPATAPAFDFNGTMREIRKTVDAYLANGQIDTAESYMESQRQYLQDNGYYIRKLNQAYFAFYGTYADSPTSISPIGQDLKTLRSRSASLKDFLDKVTGMTNTADLEASVR
jgi:hypothetical protein